MFRKGRKDRGESVINLGKNAQQNGSLGENPKKVKKGASRGKKRNEAKRNRSPYRKRLPNQTIPKGAEKPDENRVHEGRGGLQFIGEGPFRGKRGGGEVSKEL